MNRTKRVPRNPLVASASRLLLGLAMAWLSSVVASAEVSVVTDAQGRYVKSLVMANPRGPHLGVWSQIRRGVDPSRLLNAEGDRMGDSRPVLLEQPGTRQPWVVWSASDGHDKEIAYATWSGGHWLGPQLVEKIDNPYDDLDPRLAFDSAGNPVLVWWRREPVARVYLSHFVRGEWTPALAVSDPVLPGRFPSVRSTGNDAIVSFYTPKGLTVLFVPLPGLVTVSPDGSGPLDGPVPPPDVNPGPSSGGGTSPGSGAPGPGGQWTDPFRPNSN